MFPYPSGKIHMGHKNYTIGDVLADINLYRVIMFYPMGWDSFGMPAENAAKQNNLDPKTWTESNISIENSTKNLDFLLIGTENSTCSEEYYKHQQKFLELYKKELVHRKKLCQLGSCR